MTAPERPSDQASDSGERVISRKVQAGKAVYQARAMTLAKALRLSVAKVGDAAFDLALAAVAQRRETCIRDDLDTRLQGDGLLMLLDGSEGLRGAAIMDAPFVGAMIQQQTMGKVLPIEEGAPRKPTATDAAICAPFVEALLRRASGLPEKPTERDLLSGYSFGAWVEDLRVLVMALEAPEFEILRLTVDIASGVRQGNLILCLPVVGQILQDAPVSDPADDQEQAAGPAVDACRMVDTVENLRADLRVSLTQLQMSLGRLGNLQLGTTLALGEAEFDRVRIETADGRSLSRGILGQVSGKRAVHIHASGQLQSGETRTDAAGPFTTEGTGRQRAPASDAITDLDMNTLPQSGDSTGTAQDALPDLPDMEGLPDLPDVSDLPDLEDLPEFGSEIDLPNSLAG